MFKMRFEGYYIYSLLVLLFISTCFATEVLINVNSTRDATRGRSSSSVTSSVNANNHFVWKERKPLAVALNSSQNSSTSSNSGSVFQVNKLWTTNTTAFPQNAQDSLSPTLTSANISSDQRSQRPESQGTQDEVFPSQSSVSSQGVRSSSPSVLQSSRPTSIPETGLLFRETLNTGTANNINRRSNNNQQLFPPTEPPSTTQTRPQTLSTSSSRNSGNREDPSQGSPQTRPHVKNDQHSKESPKFGLQDQTGNAGQENKDEGVCGGEVLLSTLPVMISSPGWIRGKKYPRRADCVWSLHGESLERTEGPPFVRLRFIHFDVEDNLDCQYDFLEVNQEKRLCGLILDKEILLNTSVARLVFRSDDNFESRGFILEASHVYDGCIPRITLAGHLAHEVYHTKRINSQATRNRQQLTQQPHNQLPTSTVVTSPMFPENYPDAVDCWTLIRAEDPDGRLTENVTISVAFDFVDMEPDEKCHYDFVEFHDGINSTTGVPGLSIGRFCEFNVQSLEPNQDETSSRTASGQVRGLSTTRGPNFTARRASDTESFTTSPTPSQLMIRSTGPELLIHFHSDQLLNARGYRARVSVDTLDRSVNDMCNWLFDESSKTLKTPNHPDNYPANMDCTIAITAPSFTDKVVIVFDSFRFESDHNCSFDRIEIYDSTASMTTYSPSQEDPAMESAFDLNKRSHSGSFSSSQTMINKNPINKLDETPIRVYCGHKPSRFKYVSRGHRISIRFVSDNAGEYSGFSARYAFARDPANLVKNEGDFEVYPVNASVISGSSHLLSCLPRNRHHPDNENKTITWIKDDRVLRDNGIYNNGTQLLIREFTSSDSGRYICKFGEVFKEAFLTTRQAPCSMIFLKRPQDLIHSEGEDALLECHAVASENKNSKNVRIQWFKDGKAISPDSSFNHRYELLRSGYLVINGVTREDTGFYTCLASSMTDDNCFLESTSFLRVNERVNIDEVCGRPVKGLPSKQKPIVEHGKIVGGADAQKGAFPWQVSQLLQTELCHKLTAVLNR